MYLEIRCTISDLQEYILVEKGHSKFQRTYSRDRTLSSVVVHVYGPVSCNLILNDVITFLTYVVLGTCKIHDTFFFNFSTFMYGQYTRFWYLSHKYYAQNHNLNTHVDVSRRGTGLIFVLNLPLPPYFVYTRS